MRVLIEETLLLWKRINKMPSDEYFMRIALEVAKGSRCKRAKYGTVIVSCDKRIISCGMNGKPSGSNCDDICFRDGLPANSKEKPNCCIHSEISALLFSSPVDRRMGTAYISGVPCVDCCLVLANSCLSRIVYLDEEEGNGHRGNGGLHIFEQYGLLNRIEISKMTNGDIND